MVLVDTGVVVCDEDLERDVLHLVCYLLTTTLGGGVINKRVHDDNIRLLASSK